MPRLKMTAAEMVADARSQIVELDAEELMKRREVGDVVIVDIRDVRERERVGYIPGAVHAPRGMLEFWIDPDSPYHKEVFAQEGKDYVFHCASGWRSALAVQTLQDMGFDAAHLKDGFTSWKEAGGETEGGNNS